MTTTKQARDFISCVLSAEALLEQAIAWIDMNMPPEDVFSKHILSDWARRNGFVEGEE